MKLLLILTLPIFVTLQALSAQAESEIYNYQTLNSDGLTEWTVTVPTAAPTPLPQATRASEPQAKSTTQSPSTEIKFSALEIKKSAPKPLDAKSRTKNPKVVGIVGDTGCRLKEGTVFSTYQDCSDPEQWPYPQVIAKLAAAKPDLIVHVGDYHYREQCSPGKPCQKMSPATGYEWSPWQLDFFAPSKKALSTAPWIMARGNHEDCKRAYLGYKKLLVASEWTEECLDFEEPQVIDLDDLAIINLDSASISDFPEISSNTIQLWKKRIDSVEEKLKKIKAKHLWVVTHKPIYGLVKLGKAYAPTNINLKKYFESSSWASKVELILSGHVHNSQLSTAKDSPLQVVLGNGGTSLENENPPLLQANISAVGYTQGKVLEKKFGYVLVRLEDGGKRSIEFHQKDGEQIFTCHIDDHGKDCF